MQIKLRLAADKGFMLTARTDERRAHGSLWAGRRSRWSVPLLILFLASPHSFWVPQLCPSLPETFGDPLVLQKHFLSLSWEDVFAEPTVDSNSLGSSW